jgi:DNA polymerase
MADADTSPALRLRRAIIQQLESLQRAGVTVVGRAPPPAEPPASPSPAVARPPRPADGVSATTSPPLTPQRPMPEHSKPRSSRSLANTAPSLFDQAAGPKLSPEEQAEALRVLRDEVAACEQCAELVAHRTQTVFGVGSPQTRLLFFGEAPGADEDRQGEPFVGRAGQLLNKIIEACGMRREDIYIMNVLKCRPPNNRDPAPSEVGNCRAFFERQLDILRPEFICCLGKPAMAALLGTPPSVSLGRMRGQFHRYRGSKVIVTYHPAYLLRNPPAKKDTWDDMKLLLKEMGLEVPKR